MYMFSYNVLAQTPKKWGAPAPFQKREGRPVLFGCDVTCAYSVCVFFFCLGVYATTSWFLYSSNGWSMHGRYVSASLRAGRVPTAIYRARQTATSGHANDNVAAVDSAAIGRDAVT